MKRLMTMVAVAGLMIFATTSAAPVSNTGSAASGRSTNGNLFLDSVYGQSFAGNAGRLTSGVYSQQNLPDYVAGDVDGNGTVTISDVVFLINYIFAGTQAPPNPSAADTDCSGMISISDAVYLISFIFNGGAVPTYCS